MNAGDDIRLPRYHPLRLFTRVGCWLGHVPSMVLRGAIREADGGDDGIESANHWYRRAAEKGDPQAMWSLGVNYLSCKGGVTDSEQAIYWLEQAAERDHALAAWALGKMYLAGTLVARDVPRGLALLRRGAERGHAAACHSLAEIYAEGRFGLAADPEQARQWAERAAASGAG